MNLKKKLKYSLYFIAVLWLIWLIDLILPFQLSHLGILPRSAKGIVGIFFAPFLHANFYHLISNTLPLFFLMLTVLVFYEKIALKVIVLSILIGGIMVWIFGRPNYHIGVSGLIYSLAAFLIANGFFRKNFKAIVIAVGIIIFYSGLFWGMFPTHFWISWEGHLFGAIAGLFLAYLYKNDELETEMHH